MSLAAAGRSMLEVCVIATRCSRAARRRHATIQPQPPPQSQPLQRQRRGIKTAASDDSKNDACSGVPPSWRDDGIATHERLVSVSCSPPSALSSSSYGA